MNSIKCPQCGLVYWATNENCKRCGLATGEIAVDQPKSYPPPPSYRGGKSLGVANTFDEEQMIRNLKRDSYVFYVIGGLQVLLWFAIGQLLIVDALFNIGLSFIASKFRSRIAAILLLCVTVLSVMIALGAAVMGTLHFNILAPLILLGRLAASIRMVYCTFKLNSLVAEDVTQMMPPLPPSFQDEDEAQWAAPVGSAQLQAE